MNLFSRINGGINKPIYYDSKLFIKPLVQGWKIKKTLTIDTPL